MSDHRNMSDFFKIGKFVQDRYKVLKFLGAGAMARVYEVEDIITKQTLALKLMLPIFVSEPSMVKRFKREFHLCAKLSHPSIIGLHDLGQTKDGILFYTMDFLPHPTLEEKLKNCGRLDEKKAHTLALSMTEACCHAHQHGVVHRDLKPGNMLITEDERIVLIDFGLGYDEKCTKLTETGTVLGTPYYMAPEMLMGEPADARSDIYALGVIYYEMLFGEHPFACEQIELLFQRIFEENVTFPSSFDENWKAIITRCLEKLAKDRYQNCAELVEALGNVKKKQTSHSLPSQRSPRRPSLPAPAPQPEPEPSPTPTPSPTTKEPASKVRNWLLILLFAITFLTAWAFRGKHSVVISKLQVKELPGGFRVEWETNEPCPSVVVYRNAKSEELTVQKSEEVRKHSLLIGPLAPSSNIKFQVKLSRGKTSLWRSGTVTKFEFSKLKSFKTKEGLDLSWQKQILPAKLVTIRDGNTRKSFPVTTRQGKREGVLLTNCSPSTNEIELHVDVFGEWQMKYPLSQELPRIIRRRGGRLASFSALSLVKEVERKSLPKIFSLEKEERNLTKERSKEIRDEVVSAKLRKAYLELNIAKLFRENIELSPVVLGTSLLPLERRFEFYEMLLEPIHLSIFTYVEKHKQVLEFPRPDLGEFSFFKGPSALIANRKIVLVGPLSEPIEMTVGSYGAITGAQLKRQFNLSKLDEIKRVEIQITSTEFAHFALRTTINDRARLRLYDFPYFLHTYKEKCLYRQRLPLAALREGLNEFTLSVVHPFSRFTNWIAKIEKIELLLFYHP